MIVVNRNSTGNYVADGTPELCNYELNGKCRYNHICDHCGDCGEDLNSETIDLIDYCKANNLPIVFNDYELEDVHFENWCIERGII
jgi:hypothetical protein